MEPITRLAILERGEPAVRLLAAIGSLAATTDDPEITRVLVLTEPRSRAWYAREADETVEVDHTGPIATDDVVTALVAARAQAVWIGQVPCQDHVALVTACEGAGISVIGPRSDTVRRLADPADLADAVAVAGLTQLDPARDLTGHRVLEVDVLADSAGTVWAFEPRDVTVRREGHLILAEMPAPGLDPDTVALLTDGSRELARAVGYQGAGTVRFVLDPDGTTAFVSGVDTLARADHALLEETTGSSFLALRLRLARGDVLVHDQPRPDGHAVEARLLAHDADRGFAPSGGTVQLLSLPVGTGVRVDASLHDGDVIDAGVDPIIGTVTAWGHGRAEALTRLRRALQRTLVVLSGGATNRCGLLTLLDQREIEIGAATHGWYDARLATGDLVPPADPLAVVAAAVEAYEADLSLVRAAFFASAARGRPEQPEAVGTRVQLSYRGVEYRLRVDRTGPDRYRVHDGVAIDAQVDRLGEFERRISSGGRRRRVVASEQSGAFRLEIDGAAHTVTRTDGLVVRAGWPALVAQILVEPGQQVHAGDPVAVVESMKMVTTVTAPFDGLVTSVPVVANSQVERGAPLMRIRASGELTAAADLASTQRAESQLDLGVLATGDDRAPETPCENVYADLVPYLLGYDRDPGEVKGLLREQRSLSLSRPADDPELAACEDALLDLFADIASLYRPRTEAEELGEDPDRLLGNTQEYFIAFLQWLDADRAGLPVRYRARLEAALARYDVPGLGHTRALEAALLWMFRSFARVPELAPVVTTILERRLAGVARLRGSADPDLRRRLERLAHATEGRQQAVADLARDVEFHYFDAPVLDHVFADVEAEMTGHLAALHADAYRADRADRVDRLVWCPHPLRGLLLRSWLDGVDNPRLAGYRECILEVYARRFYRIRDLHGLDHETVVGRQMAFANYENGDLDVHLVVAYLPAEDLPELSRAIAVHLDTAPRNRAIVLDLVLWRGGERQDISALAAEAATWLAQCAFGRPLHRIDLTVTNVDGDDTGALRTQHVTFRQGPEGGPFVEDELYRNLHPMLGKRLDLWRLSNFALERLPSPEDVYLFSGVARDNPRDHRLFALAEVRDLVKVRDEATGLETYPRLGRMGLQALAAMRSALAAYPPRERPAANRLVLSIRPTWDIPPTQIPALAASYEPLARGAGLEKLVLHIQVPAVDEEGRPTLKDQVIHVEGIGRAGTAIRVSDPGPNPVRPLTRYAQKLLTAKRFGVPYPYEIVQMLAPADAGSSSFPRGSWVELDLDADGAVLVPVNRPPAENTAHLVVGLLTSYTDVVPEGMTRVALLSDPTQGLGNLAEPECRIVNAALAYAAEHRIPVEWYAVSSGALIAMDSGTENMDWIALTLRRLIEFTQGGGEINIIVTGINVGGQPYWNAEATMLMHTKGILIMTPASAMVLTGKQALDFSGAVSAEDNFGIGGYDRVMGLNGQAQYWAPSFQEACALLLRHYTYAYVVPGERFPRRRPTADPVDRDVRDARHASVPGSTFTRVGDVFDAAKNPDRKQPFDMRSVMRAVTDADCEPLERWRDWLDADTSIVWDATIGGIPVCLLGLESRTIPRKGFVPADGPPAWTSGTLFPQASRKTARAVTASSGNRPLVVLANLSGFDGSPESMRHWQLEYGAEIGRAVTNFDGPIVFVVVSRYHGGAFVVFSKALTDSMEIAAVQGSYASVIGGAPAAATVFAREVKQRTEKDERVVSARAAADAATGPEAGRLRAAIGRVTAAVRSEKLGEVADEFDAIHTIERALRVGSVDRIIAAADLRPYVVDALHRGMARFTEGD
jgi:acetyl/propionyl-CoA carboxylase alpha subunit/acetyl-CoA carboxylase carboxyltransferase component